MESLNSVQSRTYNKTENGTSIVEAGQEDYKDIFIKLLVGQMSNQDPFSEQDPTQYITQLAQFSMLEQMMSFNSSMEDLINLNNGALINNAVSTASSLIGKHVDMSALDESGNVVDYSGTVESTTIKDSIVYLEVKLDNSDEVKLIEYSGLVKVSDNNK